MGMAPLLPGVTFRCFPFTFSTHSCGASQQDLLGTVSGGIYQCRSFVSDSSTVRSLQFPRVRKSLRF